MPPAPRVVLDTNVCLDLFVFGDPRCAGLHEALREGRLEAVTRDDCRAEWHAVLGYPQLVLDEARRGQARSAYDACVRRLPALPAAPRLPRCADPDDQMFLELAAAAGVQAILSRDDALLKLARRTRRDGLFEILPPWAWRDLLRA
ncbi:PIN domain-containing protein [Fulvimonas sp. R45]|uniref:PIN domain-containing protein n=1 Tax=Fulvimonas sp. R45 TaxID=3045937 RepID=UPI00265F26A7|nr:PIN domain-containing protein [Fulvimonas sp. R45]MDO1528179.1 PIN domain-containing protein [Fulvimonas sp. R45]